MHSPSFSPARKSYNGKKYFMKESADISFVPVMASKASGHGFEKPSCIKSLMIFPVSSPPRLKSHCDRGSEDEFAGSYWPDFTQSAS